MRAETDIPKGATIGINAATGAAFDMDAASRTPVEPDWLWLVHASWKAGKLPSEFLRDLPSGES